MDTSHLASQPTMVLLRTVMCLALLGMAPSAGQFGASLPHSAYSVPRTSSSYSVPKPIISYGAPKVSSSHGAPKPIATYSAPKLSSSHGAPKVSSSYGAPARTSLGGSAPSHVRLSGGSGSSALGRTGLAGTSHSQGFHTQQGLALAKYYVSWANGNSREYSWDEADHACRRYGLRLVSITSRQKQQELNALVPSTVRFYWTSGMKQGPGGAFRWGNREHDLVCTRESASYRRCYHNWSHTGADRKHQPDNFEGQENCLAVLNHFYHDGITWHDIACHHQKHFICEHY